ncbi:MAG TPA: glycosyltransferase family 87 protein [Terriglobales bacterium]
MESSSIPSASGTIVDPSQVRSPKLWKRVAVLLLALCFAGGMFWFVDRMWAPGKEAHFSDLYARWYGSRELLLRGRDPYGPAVTREIQVWIYGHPLDAPGSQSAFRDENRFAYPLYIVFVLAPFVRLSFQQVHDSMRVLLPLICGVTTLLWMRSIRWRGDPAVMVVVLLMSVANFPVLESIYLQQPVLLAAFFLAGSFAAFEERRLYTSGTLLALAAIKPQVCSLFIVWILFWACSDWRIRRRLVFGFLITFGLLIGGAELLLHGWLAEFVRGLMEYQAYTGNSSVLSFALGTFLGRTTCMILLLTLALLVWRTRCEPFGSPRFYFAFASVLVVTLVTAPTMYPTNQVVLLPIFLWLMKRSTQIWAEGRWVRLVYIAAVALAAWPWLGSIFAIAFHKIVRLEILLSAVLVPVLLVPISLLIFLVIEAVVVTHDAIPAPCGPNSK